MNTKKDNLELISMLAMVCVVWWHCNCGSNVEKWFIPAFCTWSVPWFFFLSGVLFTRSICSSGVLKVFIRKLRSLVMPYCIWCVLGLVISWPYIQHAGVDELFAASLTITHPVGNRALWYVRSLVVFMMTSGMLRLILNCFGCHSEWILAAVFFLVIKWFVSQGVLLGPGSSPFYFAAGMVVSAFVLGERWFIRVGLHKWILISSAVLAAVARLCWFGLGYSATGGTILANVSSVFIIVGLISCQWLNQFTKGIKKISSLTAIVYFMHYPINDVVKHLASGCNQEVFFVTAVAIMPGFYLLLAFFLKKKLAFLYGILSGYR